MSAVLHIHELTIGYRRGKEDDKFVAGPLNLELIPGELVCILGANGSGKSTLLRTLAGLQPALGGKAVVSGIPIHQIHKKKLARLMSVVLTDPITTGNLTVADLVAFGRYPYTGWLGTLTAMDRQMVEWALQSTGMLAFQHKNIHTLSDGERQKVMIARALAQDTAIILLDEPTAHLDLPNRMEIMRLLRQLSLESGKSIVLSTHEMDLALQAADRIWLFDVDNGVTAGAPEDLVLNGDIDRVFVHHSVVFDKHTGSFRMLVDHCDTIALSGPDIQTAWTTRALQRIGFEVKAGDATTHKIEIVLKEEKPVWHCHYRGRNSRHSSIASLVHLLKADDTTV
jgi:iron complex transport system ATP-binding protein